MKKNYFLKKKQHQGIEIAYKNRLDRKWTKIWLKVLRIDFFFNIQKVIKQKYFRCSNKMSSFTNLFNSNFKDYPECNQEFSQYKLQFLHEHEQSYKELGDVLFTKDQENDSIQPPKNFPLNESEVQEDLFDFEVEVKLRRYTSFQNGFMENHRKVLKNSLQEFVIKITNAVRPSLNEDISAEITDDIKSIVFSQKLFTPEQILENRERFLKKVDEFRILKEMFQNLEKDQKGVLKDAILLGLWILKNTDHLVQSILHENSFCIKEVEKVKGRLLEYLNKNTMIDVVKQKIASENESQAQFAVMIESWLYTLLIAKLGYFDNDCFDVSVSLEEHLKALLKEQKRQHSISDSDSDLEDDEILSIQLPMKKIKQ